MEPTTTTTVTTSAYTIAIAIVNDRAFGADLMLAQTRASASERRILDRLGSRLEDAKKAEARARDAVKKNSDDGCPEASIVAAWAQALAEAEAAETALAEAVGEIHYWWVG